MDDHQIVDLFWARSESAISEASIKYGRYCHSIALNIVVSAEDAEECVSDMLLQAWNSMPANRPSLLSAYLGKITRNLALNSFRKRKAGKRGGGEIELILHELEDCLPAKNGVEDELEGEHLAKLISHFLRTLNDESMTVFVRRYWYSDSIASIAARCGISESKIKSMLFRCRNKLRAYLGSEDFMI